MNKLTKDKYDAIPDHIKENLLDAIIWAELELINYEGIGHIINVTGGYNKEFDGAVCCCFAKPEWKADHCGEYMDTASEAVVMAVCEYLSGE